MASKSSKRESRKESGGFMSFLQDSYRTGMKAAEGMQNAAMEVPFVMLETMGASEESTDRLRGKNRKLVRGMVGSIENIASKIVETGAEQVELVADAVEQRKGKERPEE